MPRSPELELEWPKFGLAEDAAFDKQPPYTTGLAQNVRNADPPTLRDRGGQRPGLTAWSTVALGAKVADLLEVAFKNKIVDYSTTTAHNLIREGMAHDIGSAYWTKQDLTVTSDDITDTIFPSGKADKLDDTNPSIIGFAYRDIPAADVPAGTYVISAYVKTDDSTEIGLRLLDIGGNDRVVNLDPAAGTVTTGGSGTGTGEVVSLGNSIYRLSVSLVTAGAGDLRCELNPDRGASTQGAAYYDAIKVERVASGVTSPTPYVDSGRGTAWQRDNPDSSDCEWCDTDRFGNQYHLYGASALRKLSHDGAIMWTHSFPVSGAAKVGTCALDESNNVYGAVTGTRKVIQSGAPLDGFILGDIDDVRLWRYRTDYRLEEEQQTQDVLIEEWVMEIDKPGELLGFVTAMKAQNGRLYTIQNDTREWKAWLVVYGGIDGIFPVKLWERQIAYPANSIDVSKDDRIVVSCESNTQRGFNPISPLTRHGLVAWTPDNLDDANAGSVAKHRIHSWYKIDDLSTDIRTDQGIDPGDGAKVIWLRDHSGNNRHLVWDAQFGDPPLLLTKGLDGRPCLAFDGSACLVSFPNTSEDSDFKDGQRSSLPLYQDPDDAEKSGQYALVGLWRPDKTTVSSAANQYVMLEHGSATTTIAGAAIIANRSASDSVSSHGADSISYVYRADASDLGHGSSTGFFPTMGHVYRRFDTPEETARVALISIVNGNGVDAGSGATKTRTIFRVNGGTQDRYTAEKDKLHSLSRVFLGKPDPNGPFSSLGGMRGEFYELITFDRKTDSSTGTGSVITHPTNPENQVGDAVGAVVVTGAGTGGAVGATTLSFSGGSPTVAAEGTYEEVLDKAVSARITKSGSGYSSAPTVIFDNWDSVGPQPTGLASMYDSTFASPTDLERVESYIMWRHGSALRLRGTTEYDVFAWNLPLASQRLNRWLFNHPYRIAIAESADTNGISAYSGQGEILSLFDEGGALLSTLSGNINGIGFGCRFNLAGDFIYTAGYSSAPQADGTSGVTDDASFRKIAIDSAGVMSSSATGTWNKLNLVIMLWPYVGIAVDSFDNLLCPCYAEGATNREASLFVLKGSDGSILEQYNYGDQDTAEGWGTFWTAVPKKLGSDSSIVPDAPDYESDLTVDVAEEVLIAGQAQNYADADDEAYPILEGTAPGALRLFRLVQSTPNGVVPRSILHGAVVEGKLYTTAKAGAPVVVEPFFLTDPAAGNQYIHSVAAFENGYYTDGVRYEKWDAKAGTAGPWTATKGQIPPRCRIVELWRGRMVLTADQEFVGAVHMSRQNDAEDWNTGAPTSYSTRAVSLGATEIGDVQDSVTGFIPYDADRAIILCDSSVWVLSGDPMAGGQLDLLSDITGGAFGRAWAKDPWGRIWFAGRRGGLWVMAGPGSVPVRVSVDRIEKRLQDIDQSAFYIRMAYDWRQSGIVVAVIPYAAAPNAMPEFFCIEIVDDTDVAFWSDKIDLSTKKITSMMLVDGDTDTDRYVVTGHQDGIIRYFDPLADDDDGTAIDAFCRWGPFHTGAEGREIKSKRASCVLAFDQNGVSWSLFTTDQADVPGTASRTGTFTAGKNVNVSCRGRGTYIFFEIRNNTLAERFALEQLRIAYAMVGTIQRSS